ncbi:MAG: aminopeptidase N [Pseudobdellovibrio sp.]
MKIELKDYTSPAYSIEQLHLYFNLHETKTIVASTIKIKKIKNEPLVLNGENLKIISIELNGANFSDYVLTAHSLTILNKLLSESFELKIQVELNPEENKSCEGLYLSKGIFCTQCEAESFRKITYMLDRPDVMTKYTVEIEADKTKYPLLLSNGDRISTRDLPNNRHHALWSDPFKKPSYLFALVAGDMGVVGSTYITKSGKEVKLEVFASHGKEERCKHALVSLEKAMKWDEVRFGLEYDLNQYMIVAIDDFNMGAMENKGLNVFNSRLVLADVESATDEDFESIESVVGHEYFHNWTGNRVTCRNWFELSLKEGLTVFRDQEFSADLNSRPVQRIKDVNSLRTRQFVEDAGPNAHAVRPSSCLAVDNFYTATIYEKGAEIIRMMQTLVGRKGFRKGMDEYFRRHDGQAVTINEFVAAISEQNNTDLSQFKNWYSQAGTPEVFVTESFDAAKKEYSLSLEQKCALTLSEQIDQKNGTFQKQPFHIPLLVGLIDAKGEELKITSEDVIWNSDEKPVLHLKQQQQNFVFKNLETKPVLSLNREFSAPVNIRWTVPNAELIHLIKFDSDEFNKYEISQKIVLTEMKRLIAKIRKSENAEVNIDIVHSIGSVLINPNLDSAFKALMLSLTSDATLALEEDIIDSNLFEKARSIIRNSIVKHYAAVMIETYKKLQSSNLASDRSLKNKVLAYLFKGQYAGSVGLVTKQYDNSKNMTDTIYALNLLCETKSAEREIYLEKFFKRWSNDSVVFNKWLIAQAGSPAEDTFDKMKSIAQQNYFDGKNPNSIYSFHGVFGKNYCAFNSNSGQTYAWFCDEIIKIDKWNPQVAARLCSSFNFVKKLPQQQKEHALIEIQRVLNHTDLSNNSRELLEKCI